jgi:hypothetical protein
MGRERRRVVPRDVVALRRRRPFVAKHLGRVAHLRQVLIGDRGRDAVAEPVRAHRVPDRDAVLGPPRGEIESSCACSGVNAALSLPGSRVASSSCRAPRTGAAFISLMRFECRDGRLSRCGGGLNTVAPHAYERSYRGSRQCCVTRAGPRGRYSRHRPEDAYRTSGTSAKVCSHGRSERRSGLTVCAGPAPTSSHAVRSLPSLRNRRAGKGDC